jgi:uncharacterized SAM-binding protein YcdF (DUF218 family)
MDVDWIGLRRDLGMFILPPAGFVLLTIAGLLLRHRRPRFGALLAWTGAIALWLASTPFVVNELHKYYVDARPLDMASARNAQAIVILGGGLRPHATEYGGATMTRWSLERVRYGALIAKRLQLPVLVAGGGEPPGMSEGEVMSRALRDEYGIEVRWAETKSLNTRQNAEFSAPLLVASHATRVVLVTQGFHMRRARAEFEAMGIEVIPAPITLPILEPLGFQGWVPRISSLEIAHVLAYDALSRWVGGTPTARR